MSARVVAVLKSVTPFPSVLRPGAILAALILAHVVVPAPGAAQTVRGAVVTQGSGEPVEGALTLLLDDGGRRVAATLSGPRGRYELTAPGPGRYRVAAERIGYATSTTPFFTLAAGAVVERTVVASVKAISLDAIRVTGTSRCRPQRKAPADVQQLWDEARKALTAVSLVEDAPAVTFQLERWELDLDPATNKVVDATRRQAEATGDYPFRSPPAKVLLERGFVEARRDSSIFYAPDAHVLLSDAFQSRYCYRVVAGDSGRLGLAFEPLPGTQPASGVEGTLWLDGASAELRSLQYTYRGMDYEIPSLLPGALKRQRRPGGQMRFRRLSNGAWIVSDWSIRAPRYAMSGGMPTSVAYVHESDGRVLSVGGLTETFGVDRTGAIVRGRLLTESGVPLPGALVYLSGTPYADTTGADGAFAMAGVRAGKYDLVWYDREYDAAAEHVKPRMVDVHAGDNPVDIRVAGMDSVLSGGCPPGGRRTGLGVIAGTVREQGTGVPLGGVRVQASGPDGRRADTTSDEGGHFRFCWLPAGSYALEAGLRGFARGNESVPVEGGRVTHPQLELTVAAVASGGHRTPPPRLTGRVLDAATGQPLDGATVRIQGTKQSRISDDDGRFVFDDVPAGDLVLQAARPGYADVSGSVSAEPGQSKRLEIRMSTQPIALEPLVVTAVQTRRVGLLADLQWRMKHETGTFIEHREIEVRNQRSIWQLIPLATRVRWQTMNCGPALYLDGVPIDDIDIVTPTSIQVIEIYDGPSTVPAEFKGSTAGCGVIAVWTKRGSPEPRDTSRTDGRPHMEEPSVR